MGFDGFNKRVPARVASISRIGRLTPPDESRDDEVALFEVHP